MALADLVHEDLLAGGGGGVVGGGPTFVDVMAGFLGDEDGDGDEPDAGAPLPAARLVVRAEKADEGDETVAALVRRKGKKGTKGDRKPVPVANLISRIAAPFSGGPAGDGPGRTFGEDDPRPVAGRVAHQSDVPLDEDLADALGPVEISDPDALIDAGVGGFSYPTWADPDP